MCSSPQAIVGWVLACLLSVLVFLPAERTSAHGTRFDETRSEGSLTASVRTHDAVAVRAHRSSGYRLPAPSLDNWLQPAPDLAAQGLAVDFPVFVRAVHHDAHVFDAPKPRATGRGRVRRGSWVRARLVDDRRGCRGRWYEVQGGGFVCTKRGFKTSDVQPAPSARPTLPNVQRSSPYRYGEVRERRGLRFRRLPTLVELQRLLTSKGKVRARPPVRDHMVGDYFLALAEDVKSRRNVFHRTVRGDYVHANDVRELPVSHMHGEVLEGQLTLPVAFVYGDDAAPLFRQQDAGLGQVGQAEKYARMFVRRQLELDGASYWLGDDGLALPADRVRVARSIEPPAGVGDGQPWVHVNLSEQTLVAYEGRRAVFATLVSSGKVGHATPPGLYQVRHKYVSTTMRGYDRRDGRYEVEEVPWTQYYDGSYALHGAYWHDDFGRVRSHGCTNLAPADARWLFYWTTPELPRGWHGVRELGTYVYITP